MKRLAILLLLAATGYCQSKPCLIVKPHIKRAAEVLHRWTEPKPFDFVEGEFPVGMKFRSELNDKHVNDIKAHGGQVIVLKPDYILADLQDARQQCKLFQEAK